MLIIDRYYYNVFSVDNTYLYNTYYSPRILDAIFENVYEYGFKE